MTKNAKTLGIYLENVILVDLEYHTCKIPEESKELIPPDFDADYDYKVYDENEDEKILVCNILFNLKSFDREDPFIMKIKYNWTYRFNKNAEIEIDKFASTMAPVHIISYIRELISNITNRGLFPVLNLPLINLIKMLKKKKQSNDNI